MSTHSRSEPKPSAQSDILRVEHLEPPARGKKSSSRHKVFLWRTPVCHDHQVNAERLLMLSGYVELNPGPVLQALQWNAGGLSDWKREKLLGEIHIILLQETQFAEAEVDRFSISQNQPLGFARPTESRGRGGGVSILIRKDIPVRLISKGQQDGLEHVSIRMPAPGNITAKFVSAYTPNTGLYNTENLTVHDEVWEASRSDTRKRGREGGHTFGVEPKAWMQYSG
ncbi:hypothetical protein AGDE_08262 [Angomonas deanei]|uniref:Endonuclease/exonuclease/phosphatase domain-containing protein n=2 Tax=Angomonas deanei TaxID=59799 RepID=A0A7G2CAG2_9TRYP|nr:hypothetical protein AGDE_08262 [Angomonas deanei]CAD2216045.1 hypothetical protein, conserved [Angomonas deanei]CAD2216048.1 hypothetical protein, conserved [Angomonas deanei]CAD2216050.1 hypothetical protein, conserved [Angomonas deanei]CAD2216051.1 hypothetical protein, conserved [Angomonas deanei]|eukprot:EPY33481.1 hypothetical protein AGDE_08262 [Angomonas deanei]